MFYREKKEILSTLSIWTNDWHNNTYQCHKHVLPWRTIVNNEIRRLMSNVVCFRFSIHQTSNFHKSMGANCIHVKDSYSKAYIGRTLMIRFMVKIIIIRNDLTAHYIVQKKIIITSEQEGIPQHQELWKGFIYQYWTI